MEEDNIQYYNDEWNKSLILDDNPINRLTEKEVIEILKKSLIKNNKPDGRRYKK